MPQEVLRYGYIVAFNRPHFTFVIKRAKKNGKRSTAHLSDGRDPEVVDGEVTFGWRSTRRTRSFSLGDQVVYTEKSPGQVHRFALLSEWKAEQRRLDQDQLQSA